MSRKRIVHHPKGMAFIYQKLNGLRPYKTLPHQLCTHKVRPIASSGRTHDVVGTIPPRHGPEARVWWVRRVRHGGTRGRVRVSMIASSERADDVVLVSGGIAKASSYTLTRH